MISCPNKNSSEYRKLVDSVGEKESLLLWVQYEGNVPETYYSKSNIEVDSNPIQINSKIKDNIQSELQTLTKQRDVELGNLEKPNFKLIFASVKDIVNSENPVDNKSKQDEIKEEYKELLTLIKCIG